MSRGDHEEEHGKREPGIGPRSQERLSGQDRGVGMRRVTRRWWAVESPLNRIAVAFGRARGLEPRQVNAIKLLLCGQFAFMARRA